MTGLWDLNYFLTMTVYFRLLCSTNDVYNHFEQNKQQMKLAERSQKQFMQNIEQAVN